MRQRALFEIVLVDEELELERATAKLVLFALCMI